MTELDVIAHEGEVLEDGTAKLIASRLPRFRGDARLYRVEPGMAYIARGDEELFSNYVVVSGVDDFYVCETYIFPADERGNVLDWGELPGSFQGYVDHEEALNCAGYEVR